MLSSLEYLAEPCIDEQFASKILTLDIGVPINNENCLVYGLKPCEFPGSIAAKAIIQTDEISANRITIAMQNLLSGITLYKPTPDKNIEAYLQETITIPQKLASLAIERSSNDHGLTLFDVDGDKIDVTINEDFKRQATALTIRNINKKLFSLRSDGELDTIPCNV